MRNHKTLLGLCIVALLCLEITLALEVEYETTAVGRIVGDSPEIMLGNLKSQS